ncbi:MAG TPA: hypothetical protein DEO83_09445 [Lachnospiraceae bacterium]|nr:hypothetical protein [Lachnospiraceae bacterium]
MCDVKRYTEIFNEIKCLQLDDTLQLIMESEDEEVREFYLLVGNFLLQQRQKKVIEQNLF